MKRRQFTAAFGVLPLAGPAFAQADDWPQRTVRVVCPFTPGGSQDNIARRLSAKLQDYLGQSFVIDNRRERPSRAWRRSRRSASACPPARAPSANRCWRRCRRRSSRRHRCAPTLVETVPDLVVTSWSIWAVPAGTPPKIKDKLRAVTERALQDAEVIASMRQGGFEPGADMSIPEVDAFIKAEHKRWGEVIRAAGIKPE